LWVVLGVVAIILLVRAFLVPGTFGIWESGYMYGWHNKANEEVWKNFKVKYRGTAYCNDCHPDKVGSISNSSHAIIPCEDCHGPAIDHPDNPPKLEVNKSRDLCLRCHAKLNYPTSDRAKLKGIDPEGHNPGIECVMCHNPHNPDEMFGGDKHGSK
jgi:predicted CXXCH cytochrome family protein